MLQVSSRFDRLQHVLSCYNRIELNKASDLWMRGRLTLIHILFWKYFRPNYVGHPSRRFLRSQNRLVDSFIGVTVGYALQYAYVVFRKFLGDPQTFRLRIVFHWNGCSVMVPWTIVGHKVCLGCLHSLQS